MSFIIPSKIRRTRPAGQALVEFALVFPILLFIIVGIIDLGRAFHAYIAITNASREGARYINLHPYKDPDGTFDTAEQVTIDEASYSGLDITFDNIVVNCPNATVNGKSRCRSGDPVRVTVDYDLDLILGWILPNPLHMSHYTEMLVP